MDAAAVAAVLAYVIDLVPHHGSPWPRSIVWLVSAGGVVLICWASWTRRTAIRAALATYVGPSAPSLPVRWKSAREFSRRETTARYGPAAWSHALRAGRAGRGAEAMRIALTVAWLAFDALALKTQGWRILLVLVTIAGLGTAIACRTIRNRANARTLACMREATGVPEFSVWTLPWGSADYLEWCSAHDIEPYPFGQPDWNATGDFPGSADGQEPDPGGS
jgi:hypothetical protein